MAESQVTRKPLINLLRGWPSASLLPVELVKSAASAALSDLSIAQPALLYGADPGFEPVREAVADWLSSFYKPSAGTIPTERLCITGGASQNLGCILQAVTDPEYTRNVWVVAPAYFLAFGIFEDAGFANKMRAVPEDEEGLDLAFLKKELEQSEEKAQRSRNDRPKYKDEKRRGKVYKHVIYCVPTFANPSSRTMSLERRRELVRVARKYDALVVCDDVYDCLQWPADVKVDGDTASKGVSAVLKEAHLPRVVDVDRELGDGAESQGADGFGNACSNGSFSKILGPGMRCGWVEGTKKFAFAISQTGTQRSGGAPSQIQSTFIAHLLQTQQLQTHIQQTLIPSYAARYAILLDAITAHLAPLGFSLPQPDREVVGGYFVWLALPESLHATALAQRCLAEENVVVAEGAKFEVPRDDVGSGKQVTFEGHLRLCFAWEDEWKLSEGVERVARVARKMLEEGDGEGEGEGSNGAYVMVEKEEGGAGDEFK